MYDPALMRYQASLLQVGSLRVVFLHVRLVDHIEVVKSITEEELSRGRKDASYSVVDEFDLQINLLGVDVHYSDFPLI